MLHEPTIEKLHALRLTIMAQTWEAQRKDTKLGSLTFDERFALLVEAEHLARDNRKLSRLLKDAQLRIPGACIEDLDCSPARGLEKSFARQLGGCAWLSERLNVLIMGPTE